MTQQEKQLDTLNKRIQIVHAALNVILENQKIICAALQVDPAKVDLASEFMIALEKIEDQEKRGAHASSHTEGMPAL